GCSRPGDLSCVLPSLDAVLLSANPRILNPARRILATSGSTGGRPMAQAQYDWRGMRRQMMVLITPINLGGAILVFVYFHWVDYTALEHARIDRESTRLNSSQQLIS